MGCKHSIPGVTLTNMCRDDRKSRQRSALLALLRCTRSRYDWIASSTVMISFVLIVAVIVVAGGFVAGVVVAGGFVVGCGVVRSVVVAAAVLGWTSFDEVCSLSFSVIAVWIS